MPISFKRYVDINSVVGGVPAVSTRALIARIFTNSPLLPTGSVLEFTSAAAVGAYFTTTSEEYKRAAQYFGWISKKNTKPSKISFGRWANAATAPLIYGSKSPGTLAALKAITAGALTLTLGGVAQLVSALDFSGAADLAAVAALLQTAIRAAHSGTIWTGATVTYDAVRGSFQFVGGATGAANIAVADGAQTPAALLGWLSGAIFSNGVAIETLTQTLTNSAAVSNNFGSLSFCDSLALNLTQVTEIATWNATQDVDYQYSQSVSAANAAAWSAALIGIEGVELTLAGPSNEYHDMMPEMVLAATPYDRRDAVQNYMFQFFPGLTATVSTDTLADTYDALRVNYYGSTQEAGAVLSFYQRGVMMGDSTVPVDMNVYANEQWLKDAAAAAIGSLLLAVGRIPVTNKGRIQIIGAIQPVVGQAIFNGTIAAGKALTPSQISAITEDTGDANAWRQVQTIGYWLDVEFASYVTTDNRTEWKAAYTLIYSKDDAVRKVEGTHVLI